jgi:HSP20 family protein
MSTLSQIREGFSHAWNSLAEGWHDLRERASHALTHFQLKKSEAESDDGKAVYSASRWGLLAAEVGEDDKQVLVQLEAPGMEPGDFEIQVVDNYLVVRGEKRLEREAYQGHYYMMERAFGSFERAIPLPAEVDESRASAKYRRGILRISLPKSQRSRMRRIEVQSS